MKADQIRSLFAYDRWATRRVLAVLDDVDPVPFGPGPTSSATGASAASSSTTSAHRSAGDTGSRTPAGRPSQADPLPPPGELVERWHAEWAAVDAWLPTVSDDFVAYVHEGVPVWQMLLHVVNHGTQHRAEAALLLTADGRSPGELDLINYAEERAANGDPA